MRTPNKNLLLLLFLVAGQAARGMVKHGLILCLHRVAPTSVHPFRPTAELSITPEFLDRLLGYLRRRKIAVMSLTEAFERTQAGDRSPFVSFTFDDG